MSKCMQGMDEKILNKAGGSAAPSAGVSDGKQAARLTQESSASPLPHPDTPHRDQSLWADSRKMG